MFKFNWFSLKKCVMLLTTAAAPEISAVVIFYTASVLLIKIWSDLFCYVAQDAHTLNCEGSRFVSLLTTPFFLSFDFSPILSLSNLKNRLARLSSISSLKVKEREEFPL